MNTRLLNVSQAQQLLAQGYRLIDIRSADEYRREHIAGAENITPNDLSQHDLHQAQVIFTCLSGMRTQSCAGQLAQATGSEEVLLLDGGLNAWRAANLPLFLQAGVKEVHTSAGQWLPSPMRFRNPGLSMSTDAEADEYLRYAVNGEAVAEMKNIIIAQRN